MRTGRWLLICALAAGTVSSAWGETIASKSYQYFTVRGTTAAELDEELLSRGPETAGSRGRHPGATEKRFGGSITYEAMSDGRCRIKRAVIKLHAKLILPRWIDRRNADPYLALVWDTLSSDIKRHEERHAEIARDHARRLERTLQEMQPHASCEEMEEAASREYDKMLEKESRASAQFDRAEGASFERRLGRMLQFRLDAMGAGDLPATSLPEHLDCSDCTIFRDSWLTGEKSQSPAPRR